MGLPLLIMSIQGIVFTLMTVRLAIRSIKIALDETNEMQLKLSGAASAVYELKSGKEVK